MTSNSEKNLPNAFLRRCVYYHIPFPDKEKLLRIAQAHLFGGDVKLNDAQFEAAIDKFKEYREQAINKKPATSEFLDWIQLLKTYDLLDDGAIGKYKDKATRQKYWSSLNTLFKNKEDLEKQISNEPGHTEKP
jgi:MoxR-like ATPase